MAATAVQPARRGAAGLGRKQKGGERGEGDRWVAWVRIKIE
jgi:hypothetical protein